MLCCSARIYSKSAGMLHTIRPHFTVFASRGRQKTLKQHKVLRYPRQRWTDSTSNKGSYYSVPLSAEETGHLSVRSIEFTDEEALSWLKRNTILRSREFIINSSIITHLKFYWKKIKCF
ncbi:hypothetical protein AOXY_G27111 [Acipenser oxyrinchus oxyrinchus]|uniref:Uncharacterized protein n=1 Tax=Acipenser oxyrinchus oxyrinchus TaxID=40147 RepID=A0AAD8FS73_ACIOX|nr:hypothetical protein AOXY_G27111 [Acipenser oxyrinchus oxyrinchus]